MWCIVLFIAISQIQIHHETRLSSIRKMLYQRSIKICCLWWQNALFPGELEQFRWTAELQMISCIRGYTEHSANRRGLGIQSILLQEEKTYNTRIEGQLPKPINSSVIKNCFQQASVKQQVGWHSVTTEIVPKWWLSPKPCGLQIQSFPRTPRASAPMLCWPL